MSGPGEAWINQLIARSAELRRAGVLSIGCEGFSATLAPADPVITDDDKGDKGEDVADAPVNPWENPASYPTGNVPSIGDVVPADKLPAIPDFEDD